jgi:glutathione S-transferase
VSDEIIFHHYWTSPFSEKVRLLFGLKGLPWRSVEQPVIMPKPDLTPLTGGYRKIPVMQIGADIYCDTQIILREIERRFPEPASMSDGGLPFGLGFWADRTFFQATVPLIFGAMGDKVDPAFVKDREALSGRPFNAAEMAAAIPLMREQWRAHAGFIEDQLAVSGDFLGGASAGINDIHAHMNIWFLASFVPAVSEPLLAGLPRVREWYARLNKIGHGSPTPMDPKEAVAIAKAATSIEQEAADAAEPNGLAPGQKVQVMADDYGRDPIAGVLVSSSSRHVAIRREDPAVGEVVVHFPRAGFWVLPG